MANLALEQRLENISVPHISRGGLYDTIDKYVAGTTALYTGPPSPSGFGGPSFGGSPSSLGNIGFNGLTSPFEPSKPLEKEIPKYEPPKLPKLDIPSNDPVSSKGSHGKPFEPTFGKNSGLGVGFVYDKMTVDGNDLYFRIRADTPHHGMEMNHLNLETIYDAGDRKPIVDNLHVPFDWK